MESVTTPLEAPASKLMRGTGIGVALGINGMIAIVAVGAGRVAVGEAVGDATVVAGVRARRVAATIVEIVAGEVLGTGTPPHAAVTVRITNPARQTRMRLIVNRSLIGREVYRLTNRPH